MSESDIDMDRCLLGIDDEAAWIPKIIWTNCAEQMPPDDVNMGVMVKLMSDNDIIVTTSKSVHNLDYIEEYEWAEFTKEKWEALNK